MNGTTATVVVPDSLADEIVKQAVANHSEKVILAPTISKDASRIEVSLPASAVQDLAEKTEAGLLVSTPVTTVEISNQGLDRLGSTDGAVTIAAEKAGNTVTLSITAGGQTVEKFRAA